MVDGFRCCEHASKDGSAISVYLAVMTSRIIQIDTASCLKEEIKPFIGAKEAEKQHRLMEGFYIESG